MASRLLVIFCTGFPIILSAIDEFFSKKRLRELVRFGHRSRDGALAVIGVAARIAVGEPRADFPQITHPDGLTAHHTERLRAGRSAVHQDESQVTASRRRHAA
jgi:hypothetical protein